jgi:hypothetical protein
MRPAEAFSRFNRVIGPALVIRSVSQILWLGENQTQPASSIGFYLAFMPLYALGLMGATRRMQHYPDTHSAGTRTGRCGIAGPRRN